MYALHFRYWRFFLLSFLYFMIFSLPYHIRVVVLAGELTDVLEVVEEKDGDTEEEGGEDYQDDQEAAI